VGGEKEITVNPRVVAATNKDLKKEIAQGISAKTFTTAAGVIIIHVPS
jgi:transcriptional regulator with AAA-type ATPase domain